MISKNPLMVLTGILIGYVAAQNESINQYQFTDENFSQAAFYRLGIKEENNVSYSKIVKLNKALNTIIAYPNPTSEILKIEGAPKGTTVSVYNTSGKQVLNGVLNNNSLNVSRLDAGHYILILDNQQQINFVKY